MMKRSFLAVYAVILTGLLAAPGGIASESDAALRVLPSQQAQPDRSVGVRDAVARRPSLRLAAADPDRGGPRRVEKRDQSSAAPKPTPRPEAVLERPSAVSGLIELTILMVSGLAVGLAGLALGRTGGTIALAALAGGAIGSAVYAFLMGSPLADASGSFAAALLIFCASALAINLFGRAGLAAVRRFLDGRRGQAATDAAE